MAAKKRNIWNPRARAKKTYTVTGADANWYDISAKLNIDTDKLINANRGVLFRLGAVMVLPNPMPNPQTPAPKVSVAGSGWLGMPPVVGNGTNKQTLSFNYPTPTTQPVAGTEWLNNRTTMPTTITGPQFRQWVDAGNNPMLLLAAGYTQNPSTGIWTNPSAALPPGTGDYAVRGDLYGRAAAAKAGVRWSGITSTGGTYYDPNSPGQWMAGGNFQTKDFMRPGAARKKGPRNVPSGGGGGGYSNTGRMTGDLSFGFVTWRY